LSWSGAFNLGPGAERLPGYPCPAEVSAKGTCRRFSRHVSGGRDYGLRLNEKQKVRFHYSVLERQFRRYIALAGTLKGNTGEQLMRLLESRLDNVVRRAGLARTIWAARQIVVHGHVLVNGRKTDRPSCTIKPGDTITFKPGVHKLLRENMESLPGHQVPQWIETNPGELRIKAVASPTSDQIPFDINPNLIIEFYR